MLIPDNPVDGADTRHIWYLANSFIQQTDNFNSFLLIILFINGNILLMIIFRVFMNKISYVATLRNDYAFSYDKKAYRLVGLGV